MQEQDFSRDGIFKPVPRWDKRISDVEDYGENNDTCEINELHLTL
jgi:hypothetical protein